jgi:large subunit ribosomal protein L18
VGEPVKTENKMPLAAKQQRRQKLRWRIRTTVSGTATKPRLSVFRSNKDIYAQLVDDVAGHTLASASSREKDIFSAGGNKVEKSAKVGKMLAERAKAAGIETCVFDRGGYLYHGRVKSLADGAREGGLKF